MDDLYSKIPKRKQNYCKYIERLERKIAKYEQVLARFGCYEDGHPLICLHCPYEEKECDCKFERLL